MDCRERNLSGQFLMHILESKKQETTIADYNTCVTTRCFGQAVPAMPQFVPLILRSWM